MSRFERIMKSYISGDSSTNESKPYRLGSHSFTKVQMLPFTPFFISNADFCGIKNIKGNKNLISIRRETDMKF